MASIAGIGTVRGTNGWPMLTETIVAQMAARTTLWIVVVVVIRSCDVAIPEDPNAGAGTSPCVEMAGVYRPGTVTLVGSERVEVPYTSWECTGYNQDTLEEDQPVLRPGPDDAMHVEVEIRDGAALDIRASTVNDEVRLEVVYEDDGASVSLPEGTQSVFVRMCNCRRTLRQLRGRRRFVSVARRHNCPTSADNGPFTNSALRAEIER